MRSGGAVPSPGTKKGFLGSGRETQSCINATKSGGISTLAFYFGTVRTLQSKDEGSNEL